MAEDDYIFLNDIQTLDTRPASTLAADWRRFLRDEQLSDVTLRVQARAQHRADSAQLQSRRSPVRDVRRAPR